jgi:stress-induced morphogen
MADMSQALHDAIAAALPDAQVVVIPGSAGHYSLEVTSAAFEGKNMLQSQRLVYGAIKELMAGDAAPVHAIDSLRTHVA